MTKKDLIRLLLKKHEVFIAKIDSLAEEDFIKSLHGKWTAGQQLEHILKSVKAVLKAFELPKAVLEEKFGTTKRKNSSYTEVVSDYLVVLQNNPNYILPEKFAPDKIAPQDKGTKLNELQYLTEKLVGHIKSYDDEDLERQILPHPVMGKLTLKEILYFTAYHLEHHDKQILQNLNNGD